MINFADFKEGYAIHILTDSLFKSLAQIASKRKEIMGIRRDAESFLNSEVGHAIRDFLVKYSDLENEEFKKHERQHRATQAIIDNLRSLELT